MALIFGNTPTWIAGDPINNFKWNEGIVVSCNPLGTGVGTARSRIICKCSGVAIIVAPISAEVSRTWYCRNDAVTTAGSITGLTTSAFSSTGWFVPCIGQLQTGYSCRSFWDSYSSTYYWSSTEDYSTDACVVNFTDGTTNNGSKAVTRCVRAFRCVTY